MTERIVVGVDGSPRSAAAVRWAAREAVARGAVLDVTHVWTRHAHGARDVQSRGGSLERAELAGREALELAAVIARQIEPTVQVREELIEGGPARRLVESAAGAALLVVGTRGHGGFAALLLGSTSQRVAARANCPVVVIGEHREAAPAGRIVVGVNVHHDEGAAVRFAFDAAVRADAEVHAVYGWAAEESYEQVAAGSGFDLEGLRARERGLLAEALAPVVGEYPQVKVVQSAADATADAVLVAASQQADLVVISARHRRVGPRYLGPIAQSVLRHASCPIAVVPVEI